MTLGGGLRSAIEHAGYYPELVSETVETALAGEPTRSWLVHHEATFDRDELRRHVTVLVLTETRLIVAHTDDHPADDTCPVPYATTSSEAVPLSRIGPVVVSRTLAEPAGHRAGSRSRRATADDLSVRVSAEGDGAEAVLQAVDFARALSAATARSAR